MRGFGAALCLNPEKDLTGTRQSGYKTQVLEFIETEHTPKNLLLRSVRRQDPQSVDLTARRESYEGLKKVLGISDWHLERVVTK